MRLACFAAVALSLAFLGPAASAPAALNQDVNLTASPYFLHPQTQNDPRWGGFPIGPSNLVRPAEPDPNKRINIARCGCLLTSLSTTVEMLVAGGSLPWFAHQQFGAGGFEPKLTFSPKYLDDYFNVGPNLASQRSPGWGFLTGSGGTNCATGVHPWAATHLADPLLSGVGATGLTWDSQSWNATSRAEIDAALLAGRPSIILRNIVGGPGMHANLIVGWDNTTHRYLIYDPLWTFSGAAPGGTNFREGATDEERYSKWFAAVQLVLVPKPVYSASLWMTIVALDDDTALRRARAAQAAPTPGVRLRLTDPSGRRTGFDPATGQMLRENTSAGYQEFTSFADPLGTLDEARAVPSLDVRDPQAGTFGLEVFGTRDGAFTLQLASVNGDSPEGGTSVSGTITAGATKRYEIARSGAGALTVDAVAAFGPRSRAGNDGSGYAGVPVSFDGRGSNQPGGTISAYSWAFGDGDTATGATVTHAYAAPGTYVATLTVTGAGGRQATDTRTLTVVPAPLHPKETIRASVSSAGAEGDSVTWFGPDVTPDGRFVAFFSSAGNLVPGDFNNATDVFVKDLSNGSIERVSVSTDEDEGNAFSSHPSISADGRFVAFYSAATNFGGANTGFYVRDRQAGTTQYIARGDYGRAPSISDDGRYVAFATPYPIAPDVNFVDTIYLRDRQAATFTHVAVGASPQISGDGRFVAFVGYDLTSPTNSNYRGVLVYNRVTAGIEVASLAADGQQLTNASNGTISADGRYVAFDVNNQGAQGSPPPPFDKPDVYLRDRQNATTEKINAGATDGGPSVMPAVSPSGRYVSFVYGTSLALSTVFQLYERDRLEGTVERMSVSNDGTSGSAEYGYPAVLTSAGDAVFWSGAPNLVPDDTNGSADVFMRRLLPPTGGPFTPLANLGGPYSGWASSAAVPAAIRLDAGGSLDTGGRALTAHWDFGDGTPPVDGALLISHAYAQPGVYEVTLTVKAASDTSAPVKTTVEVLPALPAASLSVSACAAAGATLALDGAAPAANANLIARGWDTSAGAPVLASVPITLPWGQVQAPTTLPSLSFATTAPVPGAQGNGSFGATVPGAAAAFHVPCATAANRPPLADAGGPSYSGAATAPLTLDGRASSDPEGAPLTYRWSFGDGTTGTGATPAHAYAAAGTYLATLQVNDGTNDSLEDIGTHSFALVVVGDAQQPPPPAAPPPPPPPPPPPAAPIAIASDARCANGELRLIDVYPDGRRVRIRGVAPAAAIGQAVAITFAATGKKVASAVVAADLSFATTAPLPAPKLRASNRARYSAAVAGKTSAALKLSRRMYLKAVTRAADRLRVSGQVVAPLARKASDRKVVLRLTTTCAQAAAAKGGRTVTVTPSTAGAFNATIRLTNAERSAQALYVRGVTSVRRTRSSRGVVRTATLVRGAT